MEIDRPIRVIRRDRLNQLLAEAGGAKALSSKAEKGLTDTHLIACSRGRRDIGDDLATKLEVAAKKPFGWMDTPDVKRVEVQVWPFESVEEAQFSRLTEREKGEAEAALRKAIEEIEARREANVSAVSCLTPAKVLHFPTVAVTKRMGGCALSASSIGDTSRNAEVRRIY